MNIIRRRGWEIPESCATPEHLFFDRRAFLAATGASIAATTLSPASAMAQRVADIPDPSGELYPFKQSEKYTLDRDVTPEKINVNYNNFYEYGTSKDVAQARRSNCAYGRGRSRSTAWSRSRARSRSTTLKAMPLEERLYRHRCVEAWGMAVPWSGFRARRVREIRRHRCRRQNI